MRRIGGKQQRKWKRAAAVCLAGMMIMSLTGCGEKAGEEKEGALSGTGDASDKSVAMGRYVETMTDVDTGEIMDLRQLSDGRFVLLENGAEGRWVSEDAGVTWKPDALEGWNDFVRDYCIFDMKAASDGSVAVLYESYDSINGKENESEDGEASAEEKIGIWWIPAQGEAKRIMLPIGEADRATCLCFSEDGSRLFAATFQQKIYEIDGKAGTARLFLTADIWPDMFCVWENYMALKNQSEGVCLYRLDTMERIGDDVITDFVKKNCVVNTLIMESTYSIFPAEEEGIYLVCRNGVYRHVIGGTVMEQVINGGLSSLSNPRKHVAKMIRTAEEGFMAAFSEGTLSSFAYDPNISTVPAQKLVAYSLTENDLLREAIIRYQGEHTDVYVEYRVGMDEEGAATREDAVKKLNAEIMAGKGPDLLILDGLPVNSYLEKGVLADLTPYLAELEKEETILPNIRESFLSDEKLCMLPAAITLSLYMTDRENMTDVSDLSSLADMVEKLRDEHPGEGILETYSKEMILNALMPVSAPLWRKETGELNTEELSDYLEQTKRIYEACMEGLPEEVLKTYLEREKNWIYSNDQVSAYNDLQGGALQILAGREKVTLGELKNAYNYAFLQSVRKPDNGENGVNCQVAPLLGSVKDGFKPMTLMGINAVSDKGEMAGELMRKMLTKDVQSLIYPSGFPVNEAGLQAYLETIGGYTNGRAKPGEPYGGYGFNDDSGTLISMTLFAPTEEETKELYDLLSSVHTPYLADAVVEDVVRENGKWYLEGRYSLEEAVEGIQEELAIYLAE